MSERLLPNGLTPKREKFAQLVAAGDTQADAYRKSFNVKPTTSATRIGIMASTLMAKGIVRRRVDELTEELRAEVKKEVVWTFKHSLTALLTVYKSEDAKPADKIAAIREINKMYGYGTTNINLTGSLELKPIEGIQIVAVEPSTVIELADYREAVEQEDLTSYG